MRDQPPAYSPATPPQQVTCQHDSCHRQEGGDETEDKDEEEVVVAVKHGPAYSSPNSTPNTSAGSLSTPEVTCSKKQTRRRSRQTEGFTLSSASQQHCTDVPTNRPQPSNLKLRHAVKNKSTVHAGIQIAWSVCVIAMTSSQYPALCRVQGRCLSNNTNRPGNLDPCMHCGLFLLGPMHIYSDTQNTCHNFATLMAGTQSMRDSQGDAACWVYMC